MVALVQQSKVIRILKNSKNDEHVANIDEQREHLEKVRRFQKEHLLPRFGKLIELPKMISLSKHQVAVLNAVACSKRPPNRLHKNLPAKECYALLLPDFCQIAHKANLFTFLPPKREVLAIELKPKQGFLPERNTLSLDLSVKSKISRFCLKQYHKQRRG